MGVQNTHPLYDEYVKIWEKCTDSYDGQEAIKKRRERYLPRLSGHIPNVQEQQKAKNYGWMSVDEEYDLYLQRAIYYNYIKKITNGLSEQLFRRDVKIDVPKKLQQIVDSFTHDGKSLRTAIKESNNRILLKYRDLIVLDMPVVEQEVISEKQKEELNIRPYATYYTAEQVVNWDYEMINNVYTLIKIVIRENIQEEDPDDEFTKKSLVQYRVLDLENVDSGNRIYRVRLFKEDEDKGEFVEQDPIYPVVKGKNLNYIPAFFLTQKGITSDLDYPMLNDACDLNIAHYVNSADYENALNITGSPTPVIIGYNDEFDSPDSEIALGSRALLLYGQGAEAYYMEYRGQGPEAIANAMDKKIAALAVIASKMLQTDPKGVESAETAEIHRSAEQGMLASMALSLGEAYEVILYTIADWMGIDGNVTILFNTDYSVKVIDPNLFANLTQARQAGLISQYLYFYNLLKGEMIPEDWTIEQEAEARASDVINQYDLVAGYEEPDDEDDDDLEEEVEE